MKKADKMVKFADSRQQNLPGPADPKGQPAGVFSEIQTSAVPAVIADQIAAASVSGDLTISGKLPAPVDHAQLSASSADASSAQEKSKGDNGTSYTTDFVFGGSMTESPVSRNGRKKTIRCPARSTA